MYRSQPGSARPVQEQHHHLPSREEENVQLEQPEDEMHYTAENQQESYDDGTLEEVFHLGAMEQALPNDDGQDYGNDDQGEDGYYEEDQQEYGDEVFLSNDEQWLSEHWTAKRV